jgi:hypothetical protein
LCGAAKQKKAGTEEIAAQIIRLQFVTRSLFDYFSSEFLEAPSTGVFAIWLV